jgi:hypothetical protein
MAKTRGTGLLMFWTAIDADHQAGSTGNVRRLVHCSGSGRAVEICNSPVGRNNSIRPSGWMLIHVVQAPKHRTTNDRALG